MGQKPTEKNPKKNHKVRATETIWSWAVWMFAICIPLVSVTESGVILPLLVTLSAGGGTAAVWLSPDKKQQEDIHLAQTVKTLEERVIDLEAIYISLPDTAKPLTLPETDKN